MVLVWFTTQADPALMVSVQQAGGYVCVQADTEALVRGVVAQYPNAIVIIGPDIPQAQAREVQQHYPTIHLTAQATARDLLFELSHLFTAGPEQVQ